MPGPQDVETAVKPFLAALAFGLALGLPGAALAEKVTETGTFDFIVAGLSAGTLTLAGTQDGAGYAVQGRLASSGLVSFVKEISYQGAVSGSVRDGRFRPASYREKANTGERQSEVVMAWSGSVPQVVTYKPEGKPRKHDIDAADQGGAVDPLTAAFAILKSVAPGQECKAALDMFDGRRASRIALSGRQEKGETVTCAGEYRRVAGFSPKEMARRARFPFTLTYAPDGDGRMEVVEVATETTFGKARMVRR